MKEPKYRIENGRKIYTIESRIDCLQRPAPPKKAPTAPTAQNNTAVEPGATAPQSSEQEDPDVVSVHLRLMTADDAYPSVGWLGPQLVKYGHNDGQAAKEIVDIINKASRPVPLVWNHSYDAHDIAGRVNDAYWENSIDIKPGANAWARVNRNFDPKAALGLETGEINATSIGVVMEKERSHPDMDFETFVNLAAEGAEVDGKQVAWLPVKTLEVFHHALVWSGADPNSGPRAITNSKDHEMNGGDTASINAAKSAKNPNRGGVFMAENKALEILNSLCKDLGFDVILSEGTEIPADLLTRIKPRVDAWREGLRRYSEMESRLSRVKTEILPEATTASAMDILNALIDKLPAAKYGEAFLADLRKQAVVAFDGAKTDPANKPELTEAEKKLRGVIEATTDVDTLRAWIAEYSKAKEDKFPNQDRHSSTNEPLPPHASEDANMTAEERRLSASYKRWMESQGGKK